MTTEEEAIKFAFGFPSPKRGRKLSGEGQAETKRPRSPGRHDELQGEQHGRSSGDDGGDCGGDEEEYTQADGDGTQGVCSYTQVCWSASGFPAPGGCP